MSGPISTEQGFDPVGGDGFDYMEFAQGEGWTPIAGWGLSGYDLGDWPLVMVLTKRDAAQNRWGMRIRTEGDLDTRWYASRAELVAGIDEWAAWWWRFQGDAPVADGLGEAGPIPDEFRGPFSWERLDTSQHPNHAGGGATNRCRTCAAEAQA